jgi:hypothetical protein
MLSRMRRGVRRRAAHDGIIWSCVRPNRQLYALIWQPGEWLVASTGFAVLSASACLTRGKMIESMWKDSTREIG